MRTKASSWVDLFPLTIQKSKVSEAIPHVKAILTHTLPVLYLKLRGLSVLTWTLTKTPRPPEINLPGHKEYRVLTYPQAKDWVIKSRIGNILFPWATDAWNYIKTFFLIPQLSANPFSVCTVLFLLLIRHFKNLQCLRYSKNKIYTYIMCPLFLRTQLEGSRWRAHQRISPSWKHSCTCAFGFVFVLSLLPDWSYFRARNIFYLPNVPYTDE